MKKIHYYSLFLFLLISSCTAYSQTMYVDAVHGNSTGKGTQTDPVQTLYQAMARLQEVPSKEPVTIKLLPGKYIMTAAFHIDSLYDERDAAEFTIEAAVMPLRAGWQLSSMPVIECNADSNRLGRLPHASAGFDIRRGHVSIRGLRFTGNPNPASQYYYAIERKNPLLEKLTIYRCLFEGDPVSAPMQGGIFAQGPGISVDHCSFQSAKNAVMTFVNCRDFSITHTLINHAYEGAIWHGFGKDSDLAFEFSNNIVTNSGYVWIGSGELHQHYQFKKSFFANNTDWLGINGDQLSPDTKNKPLLLNTPAKDSMAAGLDQP